MIARTEPLLEVCGRIQRADGVVHVVVEQAVVERTVAAKAKANLRTEAREIMEAQGAGKPRVPIRGLFAGSTPQVSEPTRPE